MLIEPLPPLNTLVAFESVARYGSISRAAEELNLTQSAVSRQIQQLETSLGCKLFHRKQRSVVLTVSGDLYAEQIRQQLYDISQSTAGVMGWSGQPLVTLACTSAVGSLWLSSRLSRWRQSLPELQVRLKISDSFTELQSSEFDMAIFYLREPPLGYHAIPLFDEICYPMCSPSYLATLGTGRSAAALLEQTLLVQDDPQREWTGWRDWFYAEGVSPFVPQRAWRANNYPVLLQAALQGDGVLLGWEGLVQDYLDDGSLVAAHPSRLLCNGKCYILLPENRYIRPLIRKVLALLGCQDKL